MIAGLNGESTATVECGVVRHLLISLEPARAHGDGCQKEVRKMVPVEDFWTMDRRLESILG
jgi:hypothetical protein